MPEQLHIGQIWHTPTLKQYRALLKQAHSQVIQFGGGLDPCSPDAYIKWGKYENKTVIRVIETHIAVRIELLSVDDLSRRSLDSLVEYAPEETLPTLKPTQVWHTPTKRQFDALVKHMHDEGVVRIINYKVVPETLDWWNTYKEETCVSIKQFKDYDKMADFEGKSFYENTFPFNKIEIQEYRPELNDKEEEQVEDAPVILQTYQKVGSRADTLYVKKVSKRLQFKTGCFEGDMREFKDRVAKKSTTDPHRKDYEAIIRSMELLYPDLLPEPLYYVRLSNMMTKQLNLPDDKKYLYVDTDSVKHGFSSNKQYNSKKTKFTKTEVEFWLKKLNVLQLLCDEVKD